MPVWNFHESFSSFVVRRQTSSPGQLWQGRVTIVAHWSQLLLRHVCLITLYIYFYPLTLLESRLPKQWAPDSNIYKIYNFTLCLTYTCTQTQCCIYKTLTHYVHCKVGWKMQGLCHHINPRCTKPPRCMSPVLKRTILFAHIYCMWQYYTLAYLRVLISRNKWALNSFNLCVCVWWGGRVKKYIIRILISNT